MKIESLNKKKEKCKKNAFFQTYLYFVSYVKSKGLSKRKFIMFRTYQSEYIISKFHAKQSLMEVYWTEETKQLNKDLFQKELNSHFFDVETFKPIRLMMDITVFSFEIDKNLKKWAIEQLKNNRATKIIKKIAFIPSTKEIKSDNNISSLFEDEIQKEKFLHLKSFDKIAKAQEWLLAE